MEPNLHNGQSRHPMGAPQAGDFHCGRCGTLLDGGTDEPVAARDLGVKVLRYEQALRRVLRDRREPDKILMEIQMSLGLTVDDVKAIDRAREGA